MYVVTIQLAIFNYSAVLIYYEYVMLSLSTFLYSCAIKWIIITKVDNARDNGYQLKFWKGQRFIKGSQQSFDTSSATL